MLSRKLWLRVTSSLLASLLQWPVLSCPTQDNIIPPSNHRLLREPLSFHLIFKVGKPMVNIGLVSRDRMRPVYTFALGRLFSVYSGRSCSMHTQEISTLLQFVAPVASSPSDSHAPLNA